MKDEMLVLHTWWKGTRETIILGSKYWRLCEHSRPPFLATSLIHSLSDSHIIHDLCIHSFFLLILLRQTWTSWRTKQTTSNHCIVSPPIFWFQKEAHSSFQLQHHLLHGKRFISLLIHWQNGKDEYCQPQLDAHVVTLGTSIIDSEYDITHVQQESEKFYIVKQVKSMELSKPHEHFPVLSWPILQDEATFIKAKTDILHPPQNCTSCKSKRNHKGTRHLNLCQIALWQPRTRSWMNALNPHCTTSSLPPLMPTAHWGDFSRDS